jgi:hypothetical protein
VNTHSPIIFWLLAAATLAVDSVALSWLNDQPFLPSAAILYDALCFSQLSIVCIWSVFGGQNRVVCACGVLLAIAVAAALTAWNFEFQFWEMLALFGAYATLLIVVLWIVKHSKLWPVKAERGASVWQFSLGQLLVLTTILAVLLTLFRYSELQDLGEAIASDFIWNCLMIVSLVVVWARPWSAWSRLAVCLSTALLLGVASWSYDFFRADPLLDVKPSDIPTYFASGLIQTLVVFTWLESTPIISDSVAIATPEPAEGES